MLKALSLDEKDILDKESKNYSYQQTLDNAVAAGEIVFKLFNGNSYVIITDKNFLVVKAWDVPKLPFGLKPGDYVPEGTVSHATIINRKRIAKMIDKQNSKYGFGYMAVGLPVYDKNNEIACSFVITSPVAQQDAIQEISSVLKAGVEQSTVATGNIADNANVLVGTAESLSDANNQVQQNLGVINDVIALITRIAAQTHLLGLNAAIEAARAGEHGRGFTIVAEEIRKLADSIKNNMGDVNKRMHQISSTIGDIILHASTLNGIAQEQAASTEEINAAMEQLSDNARLLEQLSKEMWF